MTMRRFLVVASLSLLSVTSACAADPPQEPTVPRPKSGDWLTRHEAFNARVRQGHVDLIFLGDSITAGWENEGRDVWNKHFAPLHAVNLGISGDRTQNVLWRLDHGNIDFVERDRAVVRGSPDPAQPTSAVRGSPTVVRGSPDPAQPTDRRSPPSNAATNPPTTPGDLRSAQSAGSGDPRTTGVLTFPLS